MTRNLYKAAVIPEIILLTNTIYEEENIDPDFKAELDQRQIVYDALYFQITEIPEIPLGPVKVYFSQTYDSNTGIVSRYRYVIFKEKIIRYRYESADIVYPEDMEHYHEHNWIGKEISRVLHPRPSVSELLKRAVTIIIDEST